MRQSTSRERVHVIDDLHIIDRGSHVVVVPSDMTCGSPIGCPTCDVLMCVDDIESMRAWNCCSTCQRMWIEGRHERWRAGWRPSEVDVDAMLRTLGMRR